MAYEHDNFETRSTMLEKFGKASKMGFERNDLVNKVDYLTEKEELDGMGMEPNNLMRASQVSGK